MTDERKSVTLLSFGALLYSILVFIPATMFLQLVVGPGVGLPAAWFIMVLFTQYSKLSVKKISIQEAAIIFALTGTTIFAAPINMIFRAYYRNSEIIELFGLKGRIPDWYAPDPSTGVFEARTFFHPAWMIPIGLEVTQALVFAIAGYCLALFAQQLYIEEEKLPFPIQSFQVAGIRALVEEEKRKSPIFLFIVIGFLYAFFLYTVPFYTESLIGTKIEILPVPYIDLTQQISTLMPGAAFGISTDLSPVVASFVLPLPVIASMVIASLSIYFFGNWIMASYDLSPVNWWVPGMNLSTIAQRSILYFWFAPMVGFGLAAGLVPVLRRANIVRKSLSDFIRVQRGKYILIPTFISLGIGVLWFAVLAPDFPLWIMGPLTFVMPFIATLISGRMVGETGVLWSASGQITNLIILASGYEGVNAWLLPNLMSINGAGRLTQLKICQLTNTSIWSLIKTFFLVYPLAILTGYLYAQLFWSLAPIPSGKYPGASIFWPINAINLSLWIRGSQFGIFNPIMLLYGFIAGGIISLLLEITAFPLSAIALAAGTGLLPPFAVTYLIGVGIRYILQLAIGRKWFEENKQILSAGLMVGETIAITLGIGMSLIYSSIFSMAV